MDDEVARRVESLVTPSARGMRPVDRLEVYREQFWLRHLPNLRDDYPTVVWALGHEAFEGLCVEYLRAHPPRTWDLQKLGANLPAYAASHPPWQGDGLACDAARLDWAFMEAYSTPDAGPFDPSVLSSAPEDAWPHVRIGLHPSVRALVLEFPVHRVRAALKDGQAPERPCAGPTRIVVWRDARWTVRDASVDPFAFALLNELARGVPLGEACERVASSESRLADTVSMAHRVGECFQEWTAIGWVTSVTFPA
jgi:hypothetical protein